MDHRKFETVLAGLAGPSPGVLIAAQTMKDDALTEGAVTRRKAALVRFFAGIRKRLGFSARMAHLVYEKKLLEQQNRAYQAEFGRMRQSEQQVRALRHDLKNHLAVLGMYAAGGQTEELVRYLNRLDQQLVRPGFIHTGNPEIDSILNYKLDRAKRAGARLKLNVRLPEDLMADAFCLNVILSNLLDNAVEGLEKSEAKELFLSLWADRGVLFLNVVNSYDGVVLRAEGPDGPAYRSRKEGQGHGLGLSIVRRAVDKYHGELRIDSTGTAFSVEAVLYLEG